MVASAMARTMQRPEWLPEGWQVEYRPRRTSEIIDKYYICPLSGRRYRSRVEVMCLLNNETPVRPAMSARPVRPATSARHAKSVRPATSDRLAKSVCPATPARLTKSVRRCTSTLVVGQRPEWLPQGWSVEFRQRKLSGIIDKYYICPLSGKKLRSKLEVMRYLNNEMLGCPASASSPSDECYKQLVEYPASPPGELYKPLAEYDHSPRGLPDGWIKETRFRKNCNRTDSVPPL